ncbi:MAG: glycosyltransferase family 1 protein [Acidimicrobiia bacterium]|nr:glycosyltransferase family 1 protein [Acidimicrobiia bacterium]
MKLLLVSPDYASHYLPLSAIGTEAATVGADVVVTTGPAMAERVAADKFRWRRLDMSRGSNPGVLGTPDIQPADVANLTAFFEATRRGMVPTLHYQATARAADLLWEPASVARAMLTIVDEEEPDAVLVDHLALSATLALRAGGHPYTTFVPGHPSQLPVGDEVYGFPTSWPHAFVPRVDELHALRERCEDVTATVTALYNSVLRKLDAGAALVEDAFGAHGRDVLYNSPAELHPPLREPLLPTRHLFLGGCPRSEALDPASAAWLDAGHGEPFVYVSFGTFLSARQDVLARVVAALRSIDARVALSLGVADPTALGRMPDTWLVAPVLPQVALLAYAGAVVTHGGNNTVSESLAAGRPMVVLPFSTDQFSTASDLERTGHAVVADPNTATVADIARAITATFGHTAISRARAVADTMGWRSGAERAAARILTSAGTITR